MVVAIPVGLGAAIYLAEYADRRLRRVLKPILETLAGVPSVVMGFFALSVISPDFVKSLFSGAGTFSLMAAGIGVGHPRRSRSSRPSPRTRCSRSPMRCARRRTGSVRAGGA